VTRTAQLGLYIDAVRHMRPGQLVARARRVVPPAVLVPPAASPPPWSPGARGIGVQRAPQSGPTPPPHEVGWFEAVGVRRTADAPALWSDRSDGLLFLFHLHGFGPLATYAAGTCTPAGDTFWADAVSSWLAAQAQPRLPGWHPFPTSSRIIAWSAALSTIDGWSDGLRSAIASSIWQQARYLCRAVERDIGGNHVLRNATALVAAGAVFPSTNLLVTGTRLLERELGRQLLSDGGHEERSPSYHREVVEELDDAVEIVRRDGRRDWTPFAESQHRAAAWQASLAGPDGRLPLLNDAWEGPPVTRASSRLTVLAESGYVVVRHKDDQLVFDAGPMCPAHLPPHAHADVLSFVLWIDGRPVVVDPGSYSYTGPWRDPFRATSGHNTVEVDERDQCQFWGDFRAAYLPHARLLSPRQEDGLVVLGGSHDGYQRLPSPVTHERRLVWWPDVGLVVIDRLRGSGPHRVRSGLHVGPDHEPTRDGHVRGITVRPLNRVLSEARRGAYYARYLGTKQPAVVMEQVGDVDDGIAFGWLLIRPGAGSALLHGDSLVLERPGECSRTVPIAWEAGRELA
jgi:Heparinase II/III-like protein/Heparinase II/III N-terminus